MYHSCSDIYDRILAQKYKNSTVIKIVMLCMVQWWLDVYISGWTSKLCITNPSNLSLVSLCSEHKIMKLLSLKNQYWYNMCEKIIEVCDLVGA